jgi:type VI secretion system protein VasD
MPPNTFDTGQQQFTWSRRRAMSTVLFGGAMVSLTALQGCKNVSIPFVAPQPTRIKGDIVAAAGLNPSVTQRPSPLRLRLYELKSATAFNQADFMALYQQDQTALGADLVAREEFVLQPGESKPLTRALAPETRVIGFVAIYRDLERAVWRTSVNVVPNKAHQLTLRAEPLAIAATIVQN